MRPPFRERDPLLLIIGISVAANFETFPYGIDVGYRPLWVKRTGGNYYLCIWNICLIGFIEYQ